MSVNPAKLREELNKRKDKWMRERQADIVSKETMQELTAEARHSYDVVTPSFGTRPPSSGGGPAPARYSPAQYAEEASTSGRASYTQPRQPPAPQGPFIAPEDVIQRLTEKISDRLRDELKIELQKEARASAASRAHENAAMDGHLAREIESHTCPVCYELMAPPDHAPLTLFPCGHVFCATCLRELVDVHGRNKCPYCREKITNRAPNLPLQHLIQSFVQKKERYRGGGEASAAAAAVARVQPQETAATQPGIAGHASSAAPESLVVQYERELAVKQMRGRVLRNELVDTEEELRSRSEALLAAGAVLDHMRSEREAVDARIRQLQAELQLIDDQVQQQAQRVGGLEQERDHCLARIDLIGRTLTPLGAELDKIHVLLQGLYNGAGGDGR